MSTTTNTGILVSDVCSPSVNGGSTATVIGDGLEAMSILVSLPFITPSLSCWFPHISYNPRAVRA